MMLATKHNTQPPPTPPHQKHKIMFTLNKTRSFNVACSYLSRSVVYNVVTMLGVLWKSPMTHGRFLSAPCMLTIKSKQPHSLVEKSSFDSRKTLSLSRSTYNIYQSISDEIFILKPWWHWIGHSQYSEIWGNLEHIEI